MISLKKIIVFIGLCLHCDSSLSSAKSTGHFGSLVLFSRLFLKRLNVDAVIGRLCQCL